MTPRLLLFFFFFSTAFSFNVKRTTNFPTFLRKGLANIIIGSTLSIGASSIISPNFNPVHVVHADVAESVFVGSYNDPNHPGCLRKITVKGKDVTIIGSDFVDGSQQFVIKAKEDYPGAIFVDFSPKGGPKNLLGVFDEKDNGIRWPDENLWTKLPPRT